MAVLGVGSADRVTELLVHLTSNFNISGGAAIADELGDGMSESTVDFLGFNDLLFILVWRRPSSLPVNRRRKFEIEKESGRFSLSRLPTVLMLLVMSLTVPLSSSSPSSSPLGLSVPVVWLETITLTVSRGVRSAKVETADPSLGRSLLNSTATTSESVTRTDTMSLSRPACGP